MSRSSFRRFEFFEVETLSEDVTTILGGVPTCITAEAGVLLFGDALGYVSITDRNFNHINDKKHKLFRGEVKGINYFMDPNNPSKQYIIAIGDDAKEAEHEPTISVSPLYLIKIYSLLDMNRPIHTINVSVFCDGILTSFAVLSDGTQISIGFSTGTVLLLTGNFLREHVSTQTRQFLNPTVLLASHTFPVSGLHFCELAIPKSQISGVPDRKLIRLFVALGSNAKTMDNSVSNNQEAAGETNNAGLIVYDTTESVNPAGVVTLSSNRQAMRVLDERGVSPQCSSLLKSTSELVVARNEAIYNYSIDDIGGALAIFGNKLCLCTVGRYTLIVSVEDKNNVPGVTASSSGGEKPRRPNVNIYDLKNKIICGTVKKYQLALNEKVVHIASDGNKVYLVTSNWALIRFREKETIRKLEVLLNSKPPLYSLAIMLAAEEQLEPAEIMKLYKSYGDHLYKKGEFEGALGQYINTIGYIPPSYVVMKFIDPYHISNLISYLEKLYEKGLTSKDHVMLLLTCYTKVKDDAALKSFLLSLYTKYPPVLSGDNGVVTTKSDPETAMKPSQLSPYFPGSNLPKASLANVSTATNNILDAQQAINTLQVAGYIDFALKIAVQYYQHESYLRLQLNRDPPQYEECLSYIAYMSFVAARDRTVDMLKAHGRRLLKGRARAFTALLIKLCTADYSSLLPSSDGSTKPVQSTNKQSYDQITAMLSLLVGGNGSSFKIPTEPIPIAAMLPIYADDRENLLVLLEGYVSQSKNRSGQFPSQVSTTLLELYLFNYKACLDQVGQSGPSSQQQQLSRIEGSIMDLLDSNVQFVQYDNSHALLLTHSYGFEKGFRFLLEKQQCVELLLRMLMEPSQRRDDKEILKLLRREGSKDPELYVQVLTHLVRNSETGDVRRGRGGHYKVSKDREDVEEEGDEADEEEEEENNSDDEYERWKAVIDVMDLIEKESILSPIQVVNILAQNPDLPLYIPLRYITRTLQELGDSIHQTEQDLRTILNNLNNYSNLSSNQTNIKAKANQKAQEKALKLHMQQQRGTDYDEDDEEYYDEEDDDVDDEIEHQTKDQQKWNSIRKAQLECSSDHEAFFKELELSADGFSTVAGYFGRSMIS